MASVGGEFLLDLADVARRGRLILAKLGERRVREFESDRICHGEKPLMMI